MAKGIPAGLTAAEGRKFAWTQGAAFLALALVALWRSRVSFTVGDRRYAMPLSLSFVLIGFILWVAENGATFLGAWQYPDQAAFWQLVHVGKWGSWALLVSLSFVLVAAVKRWEGTFYGDVGTVPAVTPTDPPEHPDPDCACVASPAESDRTNCAGAAAPAESVSG